MSRHRDREHSGENDSAIELEESIQINAPQVDSNDVTFIPMERKVLGPSQIDDDVPNDIPAPRGERWNHPRINIARTFVTFYAMAILGGHDAAYGALLPYLESYYKLSYTVVSIIFFGNLIGYFVSALLNNAIHVRFGRRGIVVLAPGARVLAYIIISIHPPFPIIVLCFILAGFGNGLVDAAWNAWIGNMERANEVLGILHAFYGLGATLSPLISTAMVTKAHLQWYTFYYIMIAAVALECFFAIAVFWTHTGRRYREANPKTDDETRGRMKEALSNKITWISSGFLLVYVGIEVALGGWVVTFMLKIRRAGAFSAGMSATAFWLGLTVGRVVLGFVTGRIGEKSAIIMYLFVTMGLQLIFWLVPNFYISVIAVSLEGFFLGPLFPGMIVAATRRLPQHLHVAGIGFAIASGAGGSGVLPFAVGAIAQAKGVQVLMPIVLALLVTDLGVWMWLPKVKL